jgi:zinc transport system substrate-binding protein
MGCKTKGIIGHFWALLCYNTGRISAGLSKDKDLMMIRLLAVLSTLPLAAQADTPRVVTDIAPIHSLTAQVMGDLGTPDLLLPPGANPHDYALRPSDAEALSAADLVVWVGHGLTPWLEDPLDTLAPQATQIELIETEGWPALDVRELEKIHVDDHEDGHDDDHGDEHHGDDHHDHGDIDPHAWLDPTIAAVWLDIIAAGLSTIDPENAATYQANADTAQAALSVMDQAIATDLADLAGRPYLLPHDGYQFFYTVFGM